jgi:hypothetical protein
LEKTQEKTRPSLKEKKMNKVLPSNPDFNKGLGDYGESIPPKTPKQETSQINIGLIISTLEKMFMGTNSKNLLTQLSLKEQQLALRIGQKWSKQVREEAKAVRKYLKEADVKEDIQKSVKNETFKKWALAQFKEIAQEPFIPFQNDQIGTPEFQPPSWWIPS